MSEKQLPASAEDWRSWEPEWLSAEQSWRGAVEAMCKILGGLEHVAGITFSQRKWRLFMAACLHRTRHIFRDERTRKLVDALDERAGGSMTHDEYLRLEEQWLDPPNDDAVGDPDTCPPASRPVACANQALNFAGGHDVDSFDAYSAAGWMRDALGADKPEERVQEALLRDIFGNPFRPPPSIAPAVLAWNDGAVAKLAKAIYDDRAFNRMPLLADALEDAACTNADIVGHCREQGSVHVRGCFVLDLLLRKE